MKKIILLLLFANATIFAQKTKNIFEITLTGKIIEASTKQPLEYATIILTNTKSKQVTGGVTNSNGNFSIQVSKGVYNMKVEFVGFKTKVLSQKNIVKNTDIGTVILSEDLETLDEVEIIAEKSTVEIKLDKKIYNVGKDMTIKGGNASDVLDNVPSVSVDAEGAVSLRGNENVRILIDGKPSSMVGLNGTDALRNLPANAIERVEVITSPSARYDAEGTAGILNIILRKGKIKGFNGSTTLSAGNPDLFGINGNLNYRTKDINIFSNLGYSYRKGPGNAKSNFTNLKNNEIIGYSDENRKYNRKNNNFNGSVGLEYFLNKKSSVTGSFAYQKSKGNDLASNFTQNFNTDKVIVDTNIRNETENEDEINTEYILNYTNNINENGEKLTIDFKYSNGNEDEYSDIKSNGSLSELNSQITTSKNTLAQIDYVLPFGKKNQFEIGHKSNLQNLTSNFKVRDANGNPFSNDPSNSIEYKQNIHAFYTQFGSKINRFSYLLGLRAEITDIDLLQINTNQFSNKNYTEWFPTINLGYEISKRGTITLGYARRLQRPRHWFLNPFETRTSNTYIFKGNPDLNPTFTSSFDLGYNTKIEKLALGTSVYYQYSTNVIQPIARVEKRDNENIFVRQPINLDTESRYGVEFTTNYNPTKWMRLSGSFNYFNYKTNSVNYSYTLPDGTTKNDFLNEISSNSWQARFNSRITLPAKIQWQTRLMYRAPQKSAQSKRKGVLVANLSFSKDIFKDKGTITLNVSDLFNSRKRENTTYTENRIAEQSFQWRERQITLNLTYRFNQKKKREKLQPNYDGGESF